MNHILHKIFGLHNPLDCIETGEVKFEYQSAFDLMITKFTQYKCNVCGRKFYYPKGSFEEWKFNAHLYRLQKEAVKVLVENDKIDEAIEVLKIK